MKTGGGLGLGEFARPGYLDSAAHPLLGGFSLNHDLLSCTQLAVQLVFPTERLARFYVGEGNYLGDPVLQVGYPNGVFVTDFWVLMPGDGGTFARADSRPMDFVVETQRIPDDAENVTITRIDLNNGEFVWQRKSLDPESINFVKFEQTQSPSMRGRGKGFPSCVGMLFHTGHHQYVREGEPSDATIEVSSEDTDVACPDLAGAVCLSYLEDSAFEIDDWYFGGSWQGYEEDQSITCFGPATTDGTKYGWFSAGSLPSAPSRAGVWITNGICGAIATFVNDLCPDDVTQFPSVGDFVLETSDPCEDATLETLALGGGCGDDGTNCDNPECPIQFCRWQWDVEHQAWTLIASNCISPSTCPEPPDPPMDTNAAVVVCTCCETVAPACGPGSAPCPGDDCLATWSEALHVWATTACITENCICQEPDRDGFFDGEVVSTICCQPEGE